MRDPRDNFQDVSRHQDRLRNLTLKNKVGKRDKDVLWLFDQLALLRSKYNELRRHFYLDHYEESVKAQAAYWQTWKDQADMIKQYYGYDPEKSAKLLEKAVEAFAQIQTGDMGTKFKGLLDVIALGPGHALSPQEKDIYLNLQKHADPVIRLIAAKQLMREDPVLYAGQTVQLFVDGFPYAHPLRNEADQGVVAGFIKPAVDRMAISKRAEFLPLAEKLFQPMLDQEDMKHIVVWRECLWPYLNSLVLMNQLPKVLETLSRIVDILEKKNYAAYSREAQLLRAELDLKLFETGGKKEADPSLARFFAYSGLPKHIRLRPAVEPPRPHTAPLDVSGFDEVPLPTRGLRRTSKSKSSEVVRNGFAGTTFAQGYTHVVDAEGNETFEIQDVQISKEREKGQWEWRQYTSRRTGPRLVATDPFSNVRGAPCERPVDKNYLMDQGMIYILRQSRTEGELVVQAFMQSLDDNTSNRRLGELSVPLGHIKDYFPYQVSAMAAGPRALYVGTPGGLIVFPKDGGEPFADAHVFGWRQDQPSAFSRPGPGTQNQPGHHAAGQPKLLTEKQGFPGDEILSLSFFRDKLFVGIGPSGESQMGLRGNCGLAAYDPETGNYDLIASSRSQEQRNPFEQGKSYQIMDILSDEQRNCLWLGLAGNPDYNGIWKYDVASRMFERVIAEPSPVQDMQWADDAILYLLQGTGLVQFDPETSRRVWLLGQIGCSAANPGPVPPRDYSDSPLYGYPETRVWPYAMKDHQLFTISEDRLDVLLHRPGQEAVARSIFSRWATAVEGKSFLHADERGVWVIAGQNAYLINKVAPSTGEEEPGFSVPPSD